METKKQKRNALIFIITNIVLSTSLMIYAEIENPSGIIGKIIPSYFFSTIAAIFAMYYLHPKINSEKGYSIKPLTWVVAILTITIIGALLVKKFAFNS